MARRNLGVERQEEENPQESEEVETGKRAPSRAVADFMVPDTGGFADPEVKQSRVSYGGAGASPGVISGTYVEAAFLAATLYSMMQGEELTPSQVKTLMDALGLGATPQGEERSIEDAVSALEESVKASREGEGEISVPGSNRPPMPSPEELPPAVREEGGHETILIADDDEDTLAVSARVLRSSGYEVLAAPNAEAALEVARRHTGDIHLLVTDVFMPGMYGPELAADMSEHYPGLSVLYISGGGRSRIPSSTLNDDAPLIKKPFTPAALLTNVRELLGARTRA